MTTSSSSTPPPPQPVTSSSTTTTTIQQPSSSSISLIFAQGTSTCVLRPNIVVRGHVDLKLISPCYASGIRVRLRAEETAIAFAQEPNGETLRNKFQHTTITLFDADVVVSGIGQHENELANWQEIAPGSYTFPFALKVPNVNFPPVIPSLEGYSIRYVWTAKVEGPFEPNLSSDVILCQFMPNVLAPKPMEWTFREIVGASASKAGRDPLSMEATLVNNSTNKISNIDIVIRRHIRGKLPVAYGDLTSQVQQEMMAETVECKVKPGETGQVDILTTVPRMNTVMLPTFETNFVKVFYELLCIIKIKRSVFSGGDTSHTCVIPIPIATHNIDNPTIKGHTPRWTTSRLQPYFFDPLWPDPTGDLPEQESARSVSGKETPTVSTMTTSPAPTPTALVTSPKAIFSPVALPSSSAISITPLLSPTLTSTSTNAMHEFLNSGSAELYRERTQKKKTLGRSKSMKDIRPASRITEWRAEREREKGREREHHHQPSSLSRSVTETQPAPKLNLRSPTIVPRSKPSMDDSKPSSAADGAVVGYTPPPPSAMRPQKSPSREQPSGLSAEQQVDLARKASRKILPNQGLYNHDGELPAEYAHYPTATHMKAADPGHSRNASDSAGSENSVSHHSPAPTAPASTPEPTSHLKPLPKRNASLSQQSYQRRQAGLEQGHLPPSPEDGGKGPSTGYDVHYFMNNLHNSNSTGGAQRKNSNDQKDNRSTSTSPSPTSFPTAATERVPYQHNLPAHQQPPGVVHSYVNGVTPSPVNSSNVGRRDIPTAASGSHPPPTFNRAFPLTEASPSSNSPFVPAASSCSPSPSPSPSLSPSSTALIANSGNPSGSGGPSPATNTTAAAPVVVAAVAGTAAAAASTPIAAGTGLGGAHFAYSSRIPPWERVEKVEHQTWFKPGPHQPGAAQVFDIPSMAVSQLQVSPLVKKNLQVPNEPMRPVDVHH
ncbi:hypothetical protein DFQ27_005440 [Actinomortierella ambigua]|uniref:Arrestin C-terminal-like domain-containing protein n=1 Tax=Actinomortierella ambigua TaxID=1343610 RepID=A0A9P6U2K5_9FUNG|nr:hypothetical protein DFQ27_005440 [Actinomortierella ambigua]